MISVRKLVYLMIAPVVVALVCWYVIANFF